MKSLTQFVNTIVAECGEWCGGIDTSRDEKYITTRVEAEGESFLTISLPLFAKELERALSLGEVTTSDFAGYRKVGKLPSFLGGFLDQIFDRGTGTLYSFDGSIINGQWVDDNPTLEAKRVAAIRAVRQICLMSGKIRRECSDERIAAAYQTYMNTERELRLSDKEWSDTAEHARFRYLVTEAVLSTVFLPRREDIQ